MIRMAQKRLRPIGKRFWAIPDSFIESKKMRHTADIPEVGFPSVQIPVYKFRQK